jgi:PKD repeat protein
VEVGSAGLVTAYADGADGQAASFDFGDASAPVEAPATPATTPEAQHTYAANGTYTISVTAAGQTATGPATISDLAAVQSIDTDSHTIAEILAWVGDDPARAQAAYDSETAGSSPRSTLLAQLETLGARR